VTPAELQRRCQAVRRRIFGLDITTFDRPGLLSLLRDSMASGARLDVTWLNPYYVQVATRDARLRDLMNAFDVLQPDGWGVVWAARLAGIHLSERLAIEDIERDLFVDMAARGQSVYLFGSAPGIAETAAETLLDHFPGLVVAGCEHGWYDAMAGHPGRYSEEDNDRIVAAVNAAQPDLLLVGLPTPLQQEWSLANRDRLSVPLLMTMGAYFDHLAERVDWYPRWMDRWRLDWAYRLSREPRRLAYRYTIGMAGYGWLVAREVVRARLSRR
jgi:N-acetylglucosaminyldiphosphoundecaprenol N-acetyl-beta-D-mannosaminyltransferase